MSTNLQFATLLRKKRILSGLSQYQVAQKCFLSRSSYNHFELGKRIPSLETLMRICSLLNANPMEFLCIITPDDIKEENPDFTGFLQHNKQLNLATDIYLLEIFKELFPEEQQAIIGIIDSIITNHSSK